MATFLQSSLAADPFQVDPNGPETIEGMELVWHDEFNNTGLPNQSNWTYEHGFVRNNELQWYQPQNAECKDGRLIITAKRDSIVNPYYEPDSRNWRKKRAYAAFSSSCIITKELQEFEGYGYYEIRGRIDTSSGSWPAIWMLGTEKWWPECGEIDLMEFYRIQNEPVILANAAWGGKDGNGVSWDSFKKPLSDFTSKDPDWVKKYHTWSMEWNKDAIRLYLDQELLNEIPLNTTVNNDGFNPFTDGDSYYILLNLAIGSNGGNPAVEQFPITYEVDYVRVYRPKK